MVPTGTGVRSTLQAPPSAAGIATQVISTAAPEEKVKLILERHGQSFCEELGIDLVNGGADALWQWFVASVLISARIKSTAGKHSGN